MSDHRDHTPLLPAAGREATARVTARAHEESISLVWFLYADHGGIIRGKAATSAMLPAGEPWDGCARTYLKRAIAEAASEGYAVTAAFEPEFTLGHREHDPGGGPDRLVPNDDSLCYSATGFHLAHDYTMDLLGALNAQGLRPEHYYPELGHGQQEMTVRYAPALRAADNHVLYRETVRGTAFRRGL